ncbi:MAG: amidohydrolase [Thalassobium sp.]|nr:MAG: amidohydrolase [Thalassobium sp.]
MPIQQGLIDVHHHLIPPVFRQTMERKGIPLVAGAPLPSWSPEKSLKLMNSNGIQTAILSLSAPGTDFGDGPAAAADLARACNEYSAGIIARFPDRFGSFAVLPTNFPELACREAEHALDVLGLEGIVLLGSSQGLFLGDPSLDELMSLLNERKSVVFVHPNLHQTSINNGLSIPGFLMEFLCDTTRAALNLIRYDVLNRYPNIRWILSHSGGFLPALAWRGEALQGFTAKGTDVLSEARKFYYDTALSPSNFSSRVVKQLVPASQILFGSDFPFAPEPVTPLQINTLKESKVFSEQERYLIQRHNAIGLFPKYASGNEIKTTRVLRSNISFSEAFNAFKSELSGRFVEKIRSR